MKAIKLLLSFLLVMSTLVMATYTFVEAATPLQDITPKHRAYKEINYLAQGEIINGSADGKFYPDRNVTRAEAAAFIGRALNLNRTQRATSFKDVGASNFASGYVQSSAEKKIITGYADGTFRPYDNVTRGEMAIMISRAFDYDYGNTTSGAVQALLSRGIAQGLAGGSFGESSKIIRADFAIFLARSIDYRMRIKQTVSFLKEDFVNTQSLNVRSGPSTKYSVIGSLTKKASVQIGYRVGSWTLIKSGTMIGFVDSSFLGTGGDTGNSGGPLASRVIVIDPGHGGKDPGAIGFNLKEKDVVLDTGLRLQKLLAKTPFTVKYTREKDVFLELSERVAFAERMKGDIFVSIHANAFNGTASGTETYYYGKTRATNSKVSDSELFAKKIQTRLIVAMGTKDRGDKHGNFHVIRENTMPAILIELAFIDNKEDNAKLASPIYRQKAANAIYLGILDYYKAKGYNVDELYNLAD